MFRLLALLSTRIRMLADRKARRPESIPWPWHRVQGSRPRILSDRRLARQSPARRVRL